MRKSFLTICISFLVFLIACGGGGGGGTNVDPRTLWIFETDPGTDFGSPALSQDEGTVYFGTSYQASLTEDHGIYALDTSIGTLDWKYHTGESIIRSVPVVDDQGAIYFVVDNRPSFATTVLDELIKVDSMGSFLWSFDLNPSLAVDTQKGSSSPAIGPDGTIYAAGDALYALSPDGTLKWSAGSSSEVFRSSPVVAPSGTVYLGFHDFDLTAFDPADGGIIWSVPNVPNDFNFGSPAIAPDGTIYVGTEKNMMYAIAPDGSIEWAYDTFTADGYNCNIRSSPAIGTDGAVYFGTSQGSTMPRFYALKPDGTLKWYFEPDDLPNTAPITNFDFYSSPAIGQDGTVYTGHEFGSVYALDPGDGSVKWKYDTYQAFTGASPALKSDGTLFIGRLYGNFYAIKTDDGGLSSTSPWPKSRCNAQNTGCAL